VITNVEISRQVTKNNLDYKRVDENTTISSSSGQCVASDFV